MFYPGNLNQVEGVKADGCVKLEDSGAGMGATTWIEKQKFVEESGDAAKQWGVIRPGAERVYNDGDRSEGEYYWSGA